MRKILALLIVTGILSSGIFAQTDIIKKKSDAVKAATTKVEAKTEKAEKAVKKAEDKANVLSLIHI